MNETPYSIELRFDADNPIAAARFRDQITALWRADDRIRMEVDQMLGDPDVVGGAWSRRLKRKAHATRVRVHGREMAHAMRPEFDA